ncbi:MAG: hypothetical protein LH615_16365 [Ferruginibacter sp.]|nr:hypothetical protein [Ferruginibacter sp.]
MIRIIISLIVFGCLLFSCKKESKTVDNTTNNGVGGGNPTPSYSIQSYPNTIGNKWVYSFYSKEETTYNNTTTTYTNSYNYTVTVVADTTMPNNNKGKIWELTFLNTNSNSRLVAYLDSTINLFKIEEIEDSFNPYFYIALNYPLTLNKTWANIGQYPLDTCKVISQEGNKLVIDRGYYIINGKYNYKISAKGLVYSTYERADVVGNQITITDYENTLISTNF